MVGPQVVVDLVIGHTVERAAGLFGVGVKAGRELEGRLCFEHRHRLHGFAPDRLHLGDVEPEFGLQARDRMPLTLASPKTRMVEMPDAGCREDLGGTRAHGHALRIERMVEHDWHVVPVRCDEFTAGNVCLVEHAFDNEDGGSGEIFAVVQGETRGGDRQSSLDGESPCHAWHAEIPTKKAHPV